MSPLEQSMPNEKRQWKGFVLFLVLGAPILFWIAVALGNALPPPFSTYVPVSDGFLRVEKVRQQVIELARTSCVDFYGDSRAAFSINARKLECVGNNYGFAGTEPQQFAYTMDLVPEGQRAETVVITLSIGAFLSKPSPRLSGFSTTSYGESAEQFIFVNPVTRWAFLGSQRVRVAMDALVGQANFENDWVWDPDLGRWIYPGVDTRVIADLPTRTSEVDTMSSVYYAGKELIPQARDFISVLAQRAITNGARTVIFLTPPQLPDFTVREAMIAPGLRGKFASIIQSVADETGALVLDCLKPEACGLVVHDFADPVHLNATGAARYSEFLSAQINLLAQ